MIFLVLILVSGLVAVFRIRGRRRGDPGQVRAALSRGGLAYLAIWILGTGAFGPGSPFAVPGLDASTLITLVWLLTGVLAFVLWTALIDVALYRLEGRDLFWVAFFGVLSALIAVGGSLFWATAAAIPALLHVRWRREMTASTLTVTSLVAFLFLLLLIFSIQVASGPMPATSAVQQLVRYSNWVRYLTVIYLVLALPRLVWGMNLQIQSVRVRLTVSHLLTGLVPAALLAMFWGLSTYLSVTADRAMMSARYLDGEAHEMAGRLEAGLASGNEQALVEWVQVEEQVRGDVRLWLYDGDSWNRAWGDPVAGEAAIPTWPDTLFQEGIVLLEGRPYLGAMRRREDAEGRRAAAVLTPLEQYLGDSIRRQTDADAFLDSRVEVKPDGRGFTVRPDTSGIAGELDRQGAFSMGAALVEVNECLDGRWGKRATLLHAQVGFFEALRGLTRNLQENPFNAVPLFFLGIVALLFVLVVLLTLGMVISMGTSITRALTSLRQGTTRLREGNLRYRIPIEGRDDLWEVAESFNRMAVTLEEARDQEIERKRLEGELALAHQIQARLLPGEAPVLPRTELAGLSVPAREVGGDYYDFLPLQNGKVGLIVADVSGKGVPAALLMSSFRAALISQPMDEEPAEVLAHLNGFLHRSVEPGRFVTAFLAVFDTGAGVITYANAGHNPPYLIDRDGRLRVLKEGGLVLGLFADSSYEQVEVQMEPGDLLALYTDGVTEAQNPEEELWGEERFVQLLRANRLQPCRRVVSEVMAELRSFAREEAQSDDITLLMARWRGAETAVEPGEPLVGSAKETPGERR